MDVNVKYYKDFGDPILNSTLYTKLIGSLVYLRFSCHDISYANYPHHHHLVAYALSDIYSRLLDERVIFSFYFSSIGCYTNADWASCQDTRQSMIG